MAKKGLTSLLVQVAAGANFVTLAAMLATGYSYLVDPEVVSKVSTWGLIFPFFMLLNAAFMVFWLFVYPKKVWIALLAFVLSYYPVRMYMGINIPKSVPEDALKVLTYNVFGFHGVPGEELERDENAIVDYLVEEDCDIICLQESSESWLSNGCKAKLTEKYPNHRLDECTAGGNFIAVYSKHRILGSERIEYESEGNLSVAYQLLVGDDTVRVINNHLEINSISLEDREKFHKMVKGEMSKDSIRYQSLSLMGKLTECAVHRAPQAKAVAKYVQEHAGEKMVLLGDFNDSPVSFARHTISKGLTDCFVSSGVGLGWTYCYGGMRLRIDNAMCSDHFVSVKCFVDTRNRFSDHYPLITYLTKAELSAE